MKLLPTGMCSFDEIIDNGYYYVDKTKYLEDLEKASRFLFFVRPRRFGKSLLLDMLSSYYDINKADRFKSLFGNLYVGEHPTPIHNKFMVLSLDFSQVSDDGEGYKEALNRYICEKIDDLVLRYEHLLDHRYAKAIKDTPYCSSKINWLNMASAQGGIPTYLMVDEYDNFTNAIIHSSGDLEQYKQLTHKTGFYREVFKKFKPNFNRILMMGVSPVTMDDLTSGYNVATNITLDPKFNSMLGFGEDEVKSMIGYYRSHGCFTLEDEDIFPAMREWYDNYCFSHQAIGKEPMNYNSDMVLYCMYTLVNQGCLPLPMVDPRASMDYGKLQSLVNLFGTDETRAVLLDIIYNGSIYAPLSAQFNADSITRRDNFVSLLYYYGMLTITSVKDGLPSGDDVILKLSVPNRTMKVLFYDYIKHRLSTFGKMETEKLSSLFHAMAMDGKWKDMLTYVVSKLDRSSSTRDLIGGERALQAYIKGVLDTGDYYQPKTGMEVAHHPNDLLLFPRSDECSKVAKFVSHTYIIEIKWLHSDSTDAAVKSKYAQAKRQLAPYRHDPVLRRLAGTTELHYLVLIVKGFDLVLLDEIPSEVLDGMAAQ